MQSKTVIADTALVPRKLEWMLTDRVDDLKTFMKDNGTFINFPSVGSQTSLISVFGDNRILVQADHPFCNELVALITLLPVRCILSTMKMQACQFLHGVAFVLLQVHFNVLMPASN